MTTYYDILDTLKEILIADEFCNTVTQGAIDDIDLAKKTIFPLSHIQINQTTYEGSILRYNVTVFVMDIVDKTPSEVTDVFKGNDNETDVLNTQLAVGVRMLEQLRRGTYFDYTPLDGNPILEPFTERFENYMAGWAITFDMVFQNDMTIC